MNYPKDRFDVFPRGLNRRGAHRAPRTRLSKLGSWLIALAAIVVLVGLGVGVMLLIDRQVQFTEHQAEEPVETPTETAAPTPTETEDPGPTAVFDAEVPVDVYNGTDTGGLATATADRLTGAGWNVEFIGDAMSPDHETTRIVVLTEEELPAAMGVVEELGFGEAVVDAGVGDPDRIVVMLGADSVDQLL